MCRLFGIISDKEVDLEFLFCEANKSLKEFSKTNHDGWGVGWYKDNELKLFKEGKKENEDYHLEKAGKIHSRIVISHVRKATQGDNSVLNAHPFKYGNFVFAHNGSIDRELILKSMDDKFKRHIKGTTDSEAYFLLIMQFYEEDKDIIKAIKRVVSIIRNGKFDGLNFLMSDGKKLYAYRECYKDEPTLFYVVRHPINDKEFEHISHETEAYIRSVCLKDEECVIVASEKLTSEEDWMEIECGELIVIDNKLGIESVDV